MFSLSCELFAQPEKTSAKAFFTMLDLLYGSNENMI